MSHVPAGKRVACRCPGFSPCRSSATGCARRGPRFACFFVVLPSVRRGADPARSGHHHRHPRAAGAEPQQRRRRRHRRRNHPQQHRRFGRGPAAPRRRCADRAQRRPRPDLGLLRPRHRHEQHGGAGRRRAHRLGDPRPGRVRGAEPRPDRPHRGAARPGVEPLRRRRRGRRDPDLHPARRGRAAHHRRGGDRRLPLVPGRPRHQRLARIVRLRRVARRREERRRLGGPARRRLRHLQSRRRRLLPQVGEPASRLDSGRGPSARLQPAREPPERAVRLGRVRRPVQPRSFARLPQSPQDPGRGARLSRRRHRQLDHQRAARPQRRRRGERRHHDHPFQDRARSGDLAERALVRPGPAARARLRVPARARQRRRLRRLAEAAQQRARRRILGPLRRGRRPGRRASRRQLRLRRQHHRPARPELRGDARAEASGARRHDLPRADLQRPVLSGLRHSSRNPRLRNQARGGPQLRDRRQLGIGRHAAVGHGVSQQGQGPDRLRAQRRRELRASGPLPAELRLRLRPQHRPRPDSGREPRRLAALGRVGAERQRRAARRRGQRHRLPAESPRRAPGERGARPGPTTPGTPARRSSSSARVPTARRARPSCSAATACSTCAPPGASCRNGASRPSC